MAEGEDIQPLVCDNGTGMVKVNHLKALIIVGNLSSFLST